MAKKPRIKLFSSCSSYFRTSSWIRPWLPSLLWCNLSHTLAPVVVLTAVSSLWQQLSGSLFLLHVKNVKHAVSLATHPPISLWVRPKTSSGGFFTECFHSLSLFYVLPVSPSPLASWVKASSVIDFSVNWDCKAFSWTNAQWTLLAYSAR